MGTLKVSGQHADGTDPVDYATRRGTILYGDPKFVKETIQLLPYSNKCKYTHLIWNWGTHKPTSAEINFTLARLHKALLPGMHISEFAACVILHKDGGKCKNQHHLHCILANHHFGSGKQYDWYSHIRDVGLYKDTVALINHARGWEQPMLARKRKIADDIADLWHLTNLRDNSLPELVQAFKKSIIEDCLFALARGDVRTREDIKNYLLKQGYTVRAKEKYLVVNHPDLQALGFSKNLRLKGEMFEEGFVFSESKRNRTGQTRYTESEIAAIKDDYDARLQTRRERHAKRYKPLGEPMVIPNLFITKKSVETGEKTPEPADFAVNQKSETIYTDEHYTATNRRNTRAPQAGDFGTHLPAPDGVRKPGGTQDTAGAGRHIVDHAGVLAAFEAMGGGRRSRRKRHSTDSERLKKLFGAVKRRIADLIESIVFERLKRKEIAQRKARKTASTKDFTEILKAKQEGRID